MSVGQGLVLPDETAALRRAYARYLTATCQQFLALEAQLSGEHRAAHQRVAALVQEALQRGQRQVLNCFASPMVGTPLQCLPLRDELPAFTARIDAAAATLLPNLLLEMTLRQLIPTGDSVLWSC